MFKKITIYCNSCNEPNPLLYNNCKKCGTHLKKKYTQDYNKETQITKRIEIFSKLQNNLELITETVNNIPENIISFSQKFRIIFLLISMAKNNCETCLSFLDLLIQHSISPNENLMQTIHQKIPDILQHLSQYEQESFPQQNIFDIQNQILNLQIKRQHNEQDNQYNQNNDEYYEENDIEYNYPEYNQPATLEQISLIKQVPTDKISSLNDDKCSICFEQLIQNKVIVHLPCGHFYHNDCIMEWLKVGNNCPLGRCSITSLKNLLN